MRKKIYNIKKGNHRYSGWQNFGFNWWNTKQSWSATLDEDCWYENPKNGINKLCGFSIGWDHQKDSIRFGWKPDFKAPNKIRIFAYYYINGKRYSNYINTIVAGLPFYVSSKRVDGAYQMKVTQGKNVKGVSIKGAKFGWGYLLYPYFGGQYTAPHDMSVYLNRH